MGHPCGSRPVLVVSIRCRVSSHQVGDTQAEPDDTPLLITVDNRRFHPLAPFLRNMRAND